MLMLDIVMFSQLNSWPSIGGSMPPFDSGTVPITTAPAPSPKRIEVNGSAWSRVGEMVSDPMTMTRRMQPDASMP